MRDDDRFDYDATRPLGLEERGREERAGAIVRDVTFADGSGGPAEAFLVEPVAAGSPTPRPGVLFAHWFETELPGDRREFLDDAVELAGDGVVSLLPQLRFPWAGDPTDAAHDVAAVVDDVILLRRGLDLLVREARAEPGRLAFAGHDFGGMHGAALAAVDRRPLGYVLMAPVPRYADWFLPFWEIAGDRHDYLRAMSVVDPIRFVAATAPARLLFQFAHNDFFVAGMTGLELSRAASEPKELKAYETEHAMDHADVRADRLAFLREVLQLDR